MLPFAFAAIVVVCVLLFAHIVHVQKFWKVVYDDQRRHILDLQNRLLAAQEEGKLIPPSDLTVSVVEPPAALDPAIEEWVSQWEDLATQQRWRNIAQSFMTAGLSVPATLKACEERLAR